MNKPTKVVSIIAGIAALIVAGLLAMKASLSWASFQSTNNLLVSLGSSFDEQGVSTNLIYTGLSLTFIVAGVIVLGAILTINGKAVGPILLLACAAVSMVGFFTPLVDEYFSYSSYLFYANVNLIETFIGIGDPIILAVFGVLSLVFILKDKE